MPKYIKLTEAGIEAFLESERAKAPSTMVNVQVPHKTKDKTSTRPETSINLRRFPRQTQSTEEDASYHSPKKVNSTRQPSSTAGKPLSTVQTRHAKKSETFSEAESSEITDFESDEDFEMERTTKQKKKRAAATREKSETETVTPISTSQLLYSLPFSFPLFPSRQLMSLVSLPLSISSPSNQTLSPFASTPSNTTSNIRNPSLPSLPSLPSPAASADSSPFTKMIVSDLKLTQLPSPIDSTLYRSPPHPLQSPPHSSSTARTAAMFDPLFFVKSPAASSPRAESPTKQSSASAAFSPQTPLSSAGQQGVVRMIPHSSASQTPPFAADFPTFSPRPVTPSPQLMPLSSPQIAESTQTLMPLQQEQKVSLHAIVDVPLAAKIVTQTSNDMHSFISIPEIKPEISPEPKTPVIHTFPPPVVFQALVDAERMAPNMKDLELATRQMQQSSEDSDYSADSPHLENDSTRSAFSASQGGFSYPSENSAFEVFQTVKEDDTPISLSFSSQSEESDSHEEKRNDRTEDDLPTIHRIVTSLCNLLSYSYQSSETSDDVNTFDKRCQLAVPIPLNMCHEDGDLMFSESTPSLSYYVQTLHSSAHPNSFLGSLLENDLKNGLKSRLEKSNRILMKIKQQKQQQLLQAKQMKEKEYDLRTNQSESQQMSSYEDRIYLQTDELIFGRHVSNYPSAAQSIIDSTLKQADFNTQEIVRKQAKKSGKTNIISFMNFLSK
ncbi:uncharacterized protein MONOS_17719 [Monocercomonoides exilis]|uniref:uncharacterized protein n=1 Tax=Monocercomonoides exilis TaxID=2049356 RepID=UPI00355A3859|nr:hypothetical protein MONOS_17719 [Monocercomonoides exilis]